MASAICTQWANRLRAFRDPSQEDLSGMQAKLDVHARAAKAEEDIEVGNTTRQWATDSLRKGIARVDQH